ncbi:MAG: hypothetical protein HYT81_05755 [Gemmatimonadetes bacterium]|nr:hypothetical protein [Gemmatimonadota bacterium]
MARTRATGSGRASDQSREEAPKRKNYRLPQSKLDAARRLLGTKTETETIERALDLVAFGERLAAATERARGRPWNDIFGAMEASGAKTEP